MKADLRGDRFISEYKQNAKFILCDRRSRSVIILLLSIGSLQAGDLQAAPENFMYGRQRERERLENSLPARIIPPVAPENPVLDNEKTVTSPAETGNIDKNLLNNSSGENSSIGAENELNRQPVLIAAPQNLNPGLRPPPPPPPEPPKPPAVQIGRSSVLPFPQPLDMKVDLRDDRDNYGQHNQIIEPTIRFRSPNGQIIPFRFGYNTFEQTDYDTIYNIPLQVGWQGKVGRVDLQAAAGVDIFNRLPMAVNLNLQASAPIFLNSSSKGGLESALFLTGVLEQGPYKFNAQTLENQITAWRFGPNVYWQIDRHTSFFSLYRRGEYNDGNTENQTFSRLERKIGDFFVATNLFTWSYETNAQETKGYFSPKDFLVYNGEVGWEGEVFDFLRCRVSASFGQQRLDGQYDFANNYQGRCTFKITPNLETDLGYSLSNVRNRQTGDATYENRSFTGQLRYRF